MPGGLALINDDFWRRSSEMIRWAESEARGRGLDRDVQPNRGPTGWHVKVTGPAIDLTTTTSGTTTPTTGTGTTVTTATTATTTTTTGTGTTSATSSSTTTTKKRGRAYPGRVLFRNMDKNAVEEQWYDCCTDCYVQELNDRPLGIGCRYVGDVVENYNGLPLIVVANQRGDESCTNLTSSTTPACTGRCLWDVDTETGNWVLEDTTCSDDCDCPPPDFCPDDINTADCANTTTPCQYGYERADDTFPCLGAGTGTTPTTSATSATTTTTPSPTDCGTGCLWKNVPGVGVINLSSDCAQGLTFHNPDGTSFSCLGCAAPDTVGFGDCSIVATPCMISPPVPPPPPCGGECRWVWPNEEGFSWINTSFNCHTGLPNTCTCVPPSFPGSFCGDIAVTACYEPVPPTTSGTGTTGTGTTITDTTSATSATTTTTQVCGGKCQFRWDDGESSWVLIHSCGSSCDCANPLADGEDGCSVAETPCVSTTTSTTSSTSATSTTTAPPCKSACSWLCVAGNWVQLENPCDLLESGCDCREPFAVCDADTEDDEIDTDCIRFAPTTTSATTATTATTANCGAAGCKWQCTTVGAAYVWKLIYDDCGTKTNCLCPYPTDPCNSVAINIDPRHGVRIFPCVQQPGGATESATSVTDVTRTNKSGEYPP